MHLYAFPPPDPQGHGATMAAGHLLGSALARTNLVFGRGPGSAFGPDGRVFTYGGGTWNATHSFTAGFTCGGPCYFGMNVAAGDFDGDGFDEIAAGKGPGLYNSQVRVFDASGGSVVENAAFRIAAFPPGTSTTYGVTLGTGNFDNDAYDDLAAGKGPGSQLGGDPLPATTMTGDIAVWRSNGTSFGTQSVGVLSDPFGMLPYALGWENGVLAGGLATGYDGDGVQSGIDGDELLVAQGPVTHLVTDNDDYPPSFLGSRIRGFSVDASGGTWTFTKIMESLVHDGQHGGGTLEVTGQPSTGGMRIARITAPELSNPYAFAPGRGLLASGAPDGTGAEDLPAWPWLSSREAAADVLRLFGELPLDLLRTPASRGELVERLEQVHDQLATRSFGEADAGLGALRQLLPGEVVNAGTLVDLYEQVDLLRRAVAQEVGNRPPVAVATPDHVYEVPWGMEARVQLTASMSTDADSTPGTTNNIRSYRWLDARGSVLGTEPDVIVELAHDRTGTTEHAITLEVVDACGAVSRTTSRVTIRGVRPPR